MSAALEEIKVEEVKAQTGTTDTMVDPEAALYQKSMRRLLQPIQAHLDDESISEIMINGFDTIYVESKGKITKTTDSFKDKESWEAAVRNITQFVGKRLTPENLSIEARLPEGHRVHIVQAPAAIAGTSVAIRKFAKEKLDVAQLIKFGSVSEQCAEFLGIAVHLAKNVIISGGTGSGKTTLLNCLSAMIPSDERIIVLEDSVELQLQQDHVVQFEVKPPDPYGRGGITMRELFRGTLRMRPDRIVVGECRGGEAIDMIQAMNSGHGGSMSTAHANTPLDAIARLEVMSLMGGVELPLSAIRAQISSAIEIIVQISRFHDGSRMLTHVSEVGPVNTEGHSTVKDIFVLVEKPDGERELQWTGVRPTFVQQVQQARDELNIELTEPLWA